MNYQPSHQSSERVLVEEPFPELQELNNPSLSPQDTPMINLYDPLWQDSQDPYKGLEDFVISSPGNWFVDRPID